MSWDYRVVHHKNQIPEQPDYWAVHEVYYTKRGKPDMMTTGNVGIFSENLAGLVKAFGGI